MKTHGREEYDQIVRALGDQLASLDEPPDEMLTQPLRHVVKGRGKGMHEGLPLWAIFALFGVTLVGIYLGLSWSLDQQAEQVRALLDQIYR